MSTETTTQTAEGRTGRVVKGGLAAAAATAVLLGGAGVFALWNNTATTDGGTISTGELSLSVTDSQWTITDTDGVLTVGSVVDPDTFRASPNDVLTFDATVDVVAEGSDMLAELTVDQTSVVIDPALASHVTVEMVDPNGSDDVIEITGREDGASQTVPVQVVVTFDDSMSGTAGQSLATAVALDALAFNLVQVAG
jgi:alternate signal-mediated exported protein